MRVHETRPASLALVVHRLQMPTPETSGILSSIRMLRKLCFCAAWCNLQVGERKVYRVSVPLLTGHASPFLPFSSFPAPPSLPFSSKDAARRRTQMVAGVILLALVAVAALAGSSSAKPASLSGKVILCPPTPPLGILPSSQH